MTQYLYQVVDVTRQRDSKARIVIETCSYGRALAFKAVDPKTRVVLIRSTQRDELAFIYGPGLDALDYEIN